MIKTSSKRVPTGTRFLFTLYYRTDLAYICGYDR